MLEVEQRHVEQIHRLVQARIDLQLLLELSVLAETWLHDGAPCVSASATKRARRRALERGAEIAVGDDLVEDELAHGAGDLDLSVEHDVRAVDDIQGLLHVVIADQHADAAVAQIGDDGLDVVHGDRIDSRERLVQHHELRLGDERARDLESPPLTARELIRLAVPQVLDAQLIQQRFQALVPLVASRSAASRGSLRCCPRRTVCGRSMAPGRDSRSPAAPLVHRHGRDVLAVQRDPARRGLDEADDHVERGRLARAIRAQQSDNLPLLQAKGHIVHDASDGGRPSTSPCASRTLPCGCTRAGPRRSWPRSGRAELACMAKRVRDSSVRLPSISRHRSFSHADFRVRARASSSRTARCIPARRGAAAPTWRGASAPDPCSARPPRDRRRRPAARCAAR